MKNYDIAPIALESKMETEGTAENLIEEKIGCGRFQVVLFIALIMFAKVCSAFSMTFMAFGNYNPGWRCLDYNETRDPGSKNWTSTSTNTKLFVGDRIHSANYNQSSLEPEYEVGSCEAYKRCRQVEFNPESSTVVTEWRLLCDDSWKPSVTISVQMLGMLFGSFVGGQMADIIGRKKTYFLSTFIGGLLHLTSSFSASWEMFLMLRFFVGFFAISGMLVGYLYMSELMTKRWRAAVVVIPDWQLGATVMAVSALILKDWRHLDIAGFVLYALAFIPVFWAPESLRWLEVRNKTEQFASTAIKMAAMNGKVLGDLTARSPETQQQQQVILTATRTSTNSSTKKYTLIELFRKDYRYKTCSVAFLSFAFSVVYYALTFGVKALYGEFYINLIVIFVVEMPFCLLTILTFRYMTRHANHLMLLVAFSICVFTTAGMTFSENEFVKTSGTTVLVAIAKGCLTCAWYVLYTRTMEFYPTVVRGLALGFGSTMARVGGVLAPFLIPRDNDSLYIYMIGMGLVAVVCCLVSLKLPETKDRPLSETFDDNYNSDNNGILKKACPEDEDSGDGDGKGLNDAL